MVESERRKMKKVIEEIIPSREILVDGVKEFLRVGVVAVLPVAIAQLESQKIDWKIVAIVFVIAVLKAIDRALHEYGKNVGNENLEKSLLRF